MLSSSLLTRGFTKFMKFLQTKTKGGRKKVLNKYLSSWEYLSKICLDEKSFVFVHMFLFHKMRILFIRWIVLTCQSKMFNKIWIFLNNIWLLLMYYIMIYLPRINASLTNKMNGKRLIVRSLFTSTLNSRPSCRAFPSSVRSDFC